jgi:hypothetical protein
MVNSAILDGDDRNTRKDHIADERAFRPFFGTNTTVFRASFAE